MTKKLNSGKWCVKLIGVTAVCWASFAVGQDVTVPPEVQDKAIKMYQGAEGPYKVKHRAHIRMHNLGFEITNYTVVADGEEAGTVSRVTSVVSKGYGKDVDVLVRFDKNGHIADMKNLKMWKSGGDAVSIKPLKSILMGRNPKDLAPAVNVLMSGLSNAADMTEKEAPPAPPEGYKLNLKQKILTTGAKMPKISATTLSDTKLNTANRNGGPWIFVFCSLKEGSRSDDMVKTVKEMAKVMSDDRIKDAPKFKQIHDAAEKLNLVYVYTYHKTEPVKQHIKELGLNPENVIVDQNNLLTKAFQIPFKPYALMFSKKGVLKANAPWQGQSQLRGMMYKVLGGTVKK